MLNDIIIRPARVSDLDTMHDIFYRAVTISCLHDYTLPQIQAWTSSIRNIERWIHKIESQFFLLALYENKGIAFGSLDQGCYLDFLYVDPDYQRKKIAREIYTRLKAESLLKGFIHLYTYASITAKPFMESMGMKAIRENHPIMGEQTLTNYLMSEA